MGFMGLVFALILLMVLPAKSQLKTGFYSKSCPKVETIVRSTVESHFSKDPSVAAGLLRLHFHDCFVEGCDGSVLIEGSKAERNALPNSGLKGFEVIEDAKARLEAECPCVVSCADILAIATRDAVDLSDGPSWSVELGRRDGRVSLSSRVLPNLPSPLDSIEAQLKKFDDKGLDAHDLVTLVGAHTIGETSCLFIRYRLYNFTSTGNSDPTLNPSFMTQMKTVCPKDGDGSKRVPLDKDSHGKFDARFYKNVRDGNAVLESDQRLWGSPETNRIVKNYAGSFRGLLGFRFNYEFSKAMVKMGGIEVKTGEQGEIRHVCSRFN